MSPTDYTQRRQTTKLEMAHVVPRFVPTQPRHCRQHRVIGEGRDGFSASEEPPVPTPELQRQLTQ